MEKSATKKIRKEELALLFVCIIVFVYNLVTWGVLWHHRLVWVRALIVTASCILGSLGAWVNMTRSLDYFKATLKPIIKLICENLSLARFIILKWKSAVI
jgi:Flp pilus assembly protein TadB